MAPAQPSPSTSASTNAKSTIALAAIGRAEKQYRRRPRSALFCFHNSSFFSCLGFV